MNVDLRRPNPRQSAVERASDQLRLRLLRHVNRRRFIAVILGAAVAVMTTATVQRAQRVSDRLGTTAAVVLASDDLATGTRLGDEHLRATEWPVDLIPPGAATSVDEISGLVVVAAIGQGEPVVDLRLGANGSALQASERAITVPWPLAPPPAEIGDRVELIGVGAIGGTDLIQTQSLGAARVVSVQTTGITLAVAEEQVRPIIEQLAVGAVEIVGTPLG